MVTAVLCFCPGCDATRTMNTQDSSIVLKVNSRETGIEEFNALLELEARVDPEIDLTRERKKEFVDYLIRKQLLIQEASRLKLDREKEFMATIERYWESTLISNLIKRKTSEMARKVLITEDDITEFYEENKNVYDKGFDQLREPIRDILLAERVNALLENWIDQLRRSSSIAVNYDLLNQEGCTLE